MKTILSFFALGLLSLLAASLTTEGYAAESYPTRPVKIIQPYPAGGPVARVLAQKLSEQTGGQFYVENLPGAGGTIGAEAASKAPSDGYTILMINQDFVVQPIIKSKVPYDAFGGFAPVGLVATAPKNEDAAARLPGEPFSRSRR